MVGDSLLFITHLDFAGQGFTPNFFRPTIAFLTFSPLTSSATPFLPWVILHLLINTITTAHLEFLELLHFPRSATHTKFLWGNGILIGTILTELKLIHSFRTSLKRIGYGIISYYACNVKAGTSMHIFIFSTSYYLFFLQCTGAQ